MENHFSKNRQASEEKVFPDQKRWRKWYGGQGASKNTFHEAVLLGASQGGREGNGEARGKYRKERERGKKCLRGNGHSARS